MPPEWTTYQRADFEVLYHRDHWHSWDEEIDWLRTKGMDDTDLTEGEAAHMAADIKLLRNDHIRFTDDPQHAYHLAKSHCNHPE